MIGLLDANNFYASCERVFRPDLMNRPVAILSNNDGCLIACSSDLKSHGLSIGVPYFKIKHILQAQKAVIFSSNFSLYGDLSCRMMSLIHFLVPRMEIYSIDEAFIDFTGIQDISLFAQDVKHQIFQALGIPTSIGIAPTKTLAKIANHLAKQGRGEEAVCILKNTHNTQTLLKTIPVKDIWGIGHRMSQRLEASGIHTAFQLKEVDPRWMRQHFTIVGEKIVRELNGISCLEVEEVDPIKKSIQVTRSFAKKITQLDDLNAILANYATRLGKKLRKRGLMTQNLMIYIRTNHHRVHAPQYRQQATISLTHPIQDDMALIKVSSHLLKTIFKEGFSYSKAGIHALNLMPQTHAHQKDLFSGHETKSSQISSNLWTAVDKMNQRYGSGTLFLATCGKTLSWKDRKDNLSPFYTTRWEDLPVVLAK